MRGMKKMMFFAVLVATGTSMSKVSKNVFEDSLEDFLHRMTNDSKEQAEFRGYYSTFLGQQQKKSDKKRKQYLSKLCKQAYDFLEENDQLGYEQVEPFMGEIEDSSDVQIRKVRTFLIRYAVFQEYKQGFMHKVARKGSHIWETTKEYTKSAGHFIADTGRAVKNTLFGWWKKE